jgi:hypothetical protein
VAVRSPKPAKDYWLGQPLPNQLPKPPLAYPKAINLFFSKYSVISMEYPVFNENIPGLLGKF